MPVPDAIGAEPVAASPAKHSAGSRRLTDAPNMRASRATAGGPPVEQKRAMERER